MGRPPSTGGPAFRFNSAEVAEMESILQAHNAAMPSREVLDALAQKFSVSEERSGKFVVQTKQVWHWFQNRRYALRAKAAKYPAGLNVSTPRDDTVTPIPQAPQNRQAPQQLQAPQPPQPLQPIPASPVRNVLQAPQRLLSPSVQVTGRNIPDSSSLEFEAKSARDGAWYDVATFLSHRKLESGDSEVLVRFAGFGPEEDEWVSVMKLVRQRSLPCESSECVAVLQGDLILCFQEGKEQALYFDAHVLDAQRRRHDVRGCRCRFLVRYDHDLSEEIVPLRKICRRPETDYRLQQLHSLNESATNLPKAGPDMRTVNSVRVYPPAEKRQHKLEGHADNTHILLAASHTNIPAVTEVKVQQPKVTEITDSAFGNSNAHTGNVIIKPKVEIVDAGDQGLSNVSPGNVVQLPEVANTTSTLGNSDVSHSPVGQRQEVRDNSSASTINVTQQPEATDMVTVNTLADSDAPPAETKQQPNVTDMVNDITLGNSGTPPPNVAQKPNVTNTVGVDTLGNADVPPDNDTQQPNTDMVSDNSLRSSDVPPADMQLNVTDMVSNGTVGVSDLRPASVTRPLDVTDMLMDDTMGLSDLPPANVTQPLDLTDMLLDDTVGNPDVPPADVVQQPEATPELDTNAEIPENANVPSDNGV